MDKRMRFQIGAALLAALALGACMGPQGNPDGQARTLMMTAIAGTAGVGKTALAVQWAHQVAEQFPDGQLYVNLRGYDPGEPMAAADALAGFLRAAGVPGQDIPAEAGERAARADFQVAPELPRLCQMPRGFDDGPRLWQYVGG